ncbi:MAG: hypothetical protein ACM3U1_00570 [Chloroflexota bacterium]
MKKVFLFAFFIVLSIAAYSQDLIVKNSGAKIQCKIVNEDSVAFYYQASDRENPPTETINKKDVQYYEYNYELHINDESGKLGKTKYYGLDKIETERDREKWITSIGLGYGGSMIGIDVENYVGDKFGYQIGGGYAGFDVGLLFHLSDKARSSAVSFQFVYTRLPNNHGITAIIPGFIFRAGKIFTCQFGAAVILSNDDMEYDDLTVRPTIGAGIYWGN